MTMAIAANTPDQEKPTLLIENVFTEGTLSGQGLSTMENALGDNTFDFWSPSQAFANMEVDLGSDRECNCIGIAAHTLGTVGADALVQSSENGTDWTTRLTISPINDRTIVGIFPSVSARYWRLRIADGPAVIGVAKLGKRIVVPSGVVIGHVSANHAERVELLSNDSVDGQFLGTRVIRRSGETNLDFGLVPTSFIDTDMLVFEMMYNDGRAFFYAGSPSGLPLDVAYCKRPVGRSEMRPSHEGGDLMQLDFEVQIYAG